MTKPLIITSLFSSRHDTGPDHPESTERIQILDGLFRDYDQLKATPADWDIITLAHSPRYIDSLIMNIPEGGYRALDGDTIICPDSIESAYHAAGAACLGVDQIMTHDIGRVFCAVRPPGHHALEGKSMGFCVFNNLFIAARYAQTHYDVKKIGIIDFDVHHGNGTETMAMKHNAANPEKPIFYTSTHAHPLFPMTGDPADNHDLLLNIRLSEGQKSNEFREAYNEHIFPRLQIFKPDLLLVSAGFDAHKDDALGTLNLDYDDFSWISRSINNAFQCPILSVLEGGYNTTVLRECVMRYCEGLTY